MTTRGFNTVCEPACNESNTPTDAWDQAAVATRPTVPCDFRLSWAASAGSITLSWLPVSTIKSNGPEWLTMTGTTSKAPATIRGLMPAMLPGQCVSAWQEMDVNANAAARRTQREVQIDANFMSASARGVRAEGDIGGYIWLPQWIGGKIHVNEIWKRCGST